MSWIPPLIWAITPRLWLPSMSLKKRDVLPPAYAPNWFTPTPIVGWPTKSRPSLALYGLESGSASLGRPLVEFASCRSGSRGVAAEGGRLTVAAFRSGSRGGSPARTPASSAA